MSLQALVGCAFLCIRPWLTESGAPVLVPFEIFCQCHVRLSYDAQPRDADAATVGSGGHGPTTVVQSGDERE